MAGHVPAIPTRTELAKDAIPVSKHPMETAVTSPAMTVWQRVQYVNSKGGWY